MSQLPLPPEPFRLTSADTLEMQEGSGCLAAVGVPFLAAGLFMALSFTGALPYEAAPTREAGTLALGLMTFVFLAAGAVLLFGRRRLFLDLTSGSAIRQHGLLIPIRTNRRPLSEFTSVVLAFERGDSDSPNRYPVRLRAVRGKDFVISTTSQFSRAREHAEYVSRFLRLPLADATTDHETVVDPERAGESLQERLRADGSEPEYAVRPPDTRCEVIETASDTRIVIDRPRIPLVAVVGVVGPAMIFLLFGSTIVQSIWSAHRVPSLSNPLLILVLIFGMVTIVAGVNLLVGRRRRRTTVTVSPTGLVIERRGAWRFQTTMVPAVEIIDIDESTVDGILASTKRPFHVTAPSETENDRLLAKLMTWALNSGIVVKTRQDVITFGEGLPASELHYLRQVLRNALTHR